MDEDLKKRFSAVVEAVGLDAPSAVRMLAVQTVRDQRLPLSLSVPGGDSSTMDFLDQVRADWGEW
jgi:addiction module RelB/DinJ family antitoxin